MMVIRLGLEVLRDSDFALLDGCRVGLMTNPSAVDQQLTSAYAVLTGASAVNMTALYAPEHGFAGAVADTEVIATTTDPRTGLPVYSLYEGDDFRPTSELLAGVDVLVCDIQDIGVRYYTYTWTISHLLEAAGEVGVRVVILDRPNPLGGVQIMGPTLEMNQSSLVGRFSVPVQHGLTLGEIARLINATWNPTPADLTVVPCDGWSRDQCWEQTGLAWVPPSPNMPHLSTLHHYPGACLVEGTNLSEGRGTALPFEIVGAPWIDAGALVDRLNADDWAGSLGAGFRPHSFRPTESKWAGAECQGVQVHIVDPARWRPLEVWLGVIATIRALYPPEFQWLASHFDHLIGAAWVRGALEAITDQSPGITLARLAAEWTEDNHAFEIERQPYLLYDRE